MKFFNVKTIAWAVIIGAITLNVIFSPTFDSRLLSAAYEITKLSVAIGVILLAYLIARSLLGKGGLLPPFILIAFIPISAYGVHALDKWIEEGINHQQESSFNYPDNHSALDRSFSSAALLKSAYRRSSCLQSRSAAPLIQRTCFNMITT